MAALRREALMHRLFGRGQQQPFPSSNNNKCSIGAATTIPFLAVNDEPSAASLLAQEKDPPAPMVGMKPAAQQQLQLPPAAPADSTPPAGPPPDNGNRGGQAGNQFGRAAHGSGNPANANKQ